MSGLPVVVLMPAPLATTVALVVAASPPLLLRLTDVDCVEATMQCAGTIIRPGEVQFFLRLHGLWEGVEIRSRYFPAKSHALADWWRKSRDGA